MNIISKRLLFVVLGASVSLTTPLSAQTSSTAGTKRVTITATRPPTGAGERGDRRVVYYITNTTATGSNIPMVYQRYQGQTSARGSAFQTGSAYNIKSADVTGSLSVGGTLRGLDPAIR